MVDYLAIPALKFFVLEESYVLDVAESDDTVSIRMDLVYAKDHPELLPARAGEWTYFREGVLRFRGVTEFEWTDKSEPAGEADGSHSWDGFEAFEQNGDRYTLRGDVGLIEIVANSIEVEMTGPA